MDVEAKQHVDELLEQLSPDQVAAVVQLLEVMVESDDEPLTEEDRRAVAASREYFRQNPREASRSNRWWQISASPWIRFVATRANEDRVKRIRFEPNVPSELRAIAQQTALGILKWLR